MTRAPLRVAYLSGTSYCGSTLMALLMDCHPQVVSVGEASFNRAAQRRSANKPACSCGSALHVCPFWTRLFEMVTASGLELGPARWTNDYKYKHPLLHRLLTQYPSHRLGQAVYGALDRVPFHRARIRRTDRVNVAFVRAALAIKQADVFFDTTKGLVRLHYLVRIPELDVRVINVVRDACGFVNSAKRRGESVAGAAERWMKHHRAAEALLERLPPDRVFVLKYEDLCRDPRHWLLQLYDFIGVARVDPPVEVSPHEHHVLGNNMRKQRATLAIRLDESWRESLTTQEVSEVLRVAGAVNQRFGYST